jgi:cysteine-rich repeat protein
VAALLILGGCAGSGGALESCGNGTVEGLGDDGNVVEGDGCNSDCEIEAGGGTCGDATVDPGEDCDDGNAIDGDGCNSDCEIEAGNNTLAWIQTNVFTPICTECHTPSGPGPMPLTSEQVSFDNLVDVASIEVALDRVEPFDPEMSYIVHKVEGRLTILGTRMPPPPRAMLTQEQIDAIIGWIELGAPR